VFTDVWSSTFPAIGLSILWGSGFRPCQNLIQWKDGWHGRSTLLPWWPLLQTWACPYVSLCPSTWDWWLGPLPRSPGMGEGGDWWSWPMCLIAEGILRGCQGLFTPVSWDTHYQFSIKKSTFKINIKNKTTRTNHENKHKLLFYMCVLHPCSVFLNVYCVACRYYLNTCVRVCHSFQESWSIARVPSSQALEG